MRRSPGSSPSEPGGNEPIKVRLDPIAIEEPAKPETISQPAAVATKDSDPHRAAAEMAMRLGAHTFFEALSPGGGLDPGLLPQGRFAIHSASAEHSTEFSDVHVRQLAAIPSLRAFRASSNITDESLKALSESSGLEALHLDHAAVTDAGISLLAGHDELQRLTLHRTAITDAACESLATMSSLRKLKLSMTQITDAGLKALSTAPSLNDLEINDNRTITPAGLTHLEALESLQTLNLERIPLGDDAVPVLTRMQNLRMLHVRSTRITDAGISRLHESLPRCSILHDNTSASPANRTRRRMGSETQCRNTPGVTGRR